MPLAAWAGIDAPKVSVAANMAVASVPFPICMMSSPSIVVGGVLHSTEMIHLTADRRMVMLEL